MIDYTITIGNLIEVGAFVGGGFVALISMRGTVNTLKNDVIDMKTEIKKVGDVLIKMAVTDTRLSNVEQDIRELKHGEGFIFPLDRTKRSGG